MNITTKDIQFPILMHGPRRVGLRLYRKREDMIEKASSLKYRPRNGSFRIISENLVIYKITDFLVIGGVGPFGGYYFNGPLLIERKVRFDVVLSQYKETDMEQMCQFYCGLLEYEKDKVRGFQERFMAQARQKALGVAGSHDLFVQLAEAMSQSEGGGNPTGSGR